MLFKSVTKLSGITEKNYFKEKINIYVRLVEAYKEKYSIIDNTSRLIQLETIEEIVNIGVIDSYDEMDQLEQLVGRDLFHMFVDSVHFYIENRDKMGSILDQLSNLKRRELQRVEEQSNKATLIDFFCGAGGFSLGFIQEGFSVKLANDIDELAIETYKFNHPEVSSDKIIQGDIKELVERVEDYIQDDIDVVIGGPPCQGFSTANQKRIIDDPRNELYKYFVNAVEKTAPKFVVMENVKGMLKVAEQVAEDFKLLKINKDGKDYYYDVGYRLFNSKDFSVAQSRERLIYIAIRNDIQSNYNIDAHSIFEIIEKNNEGNREYTLADTLEFLKPLEAPNKRNFGEIDSEKYGKKVDINYFKGNENDYLKIINMNCEMPFVFNHKARYLNDINYEIYRRLDQGDDATNYKIADIMPYAHRNDKFKDKYYKLIEDRPCRTITAHLRSDGHSHIHPFQIRTLTPREAARIQSFPDNYFFLGPYLKTFIQIGNAVPILMARGIAKVIKQYIR